MITATPTMTVREIPLHGARTLSAATPRFNMVAFHWRGTGGVRYRVRFSDGWSPWRLADDDTVSVQRGWHIGNLDWVGTATALDTRVVGRVMRLRSYTVWSPPERLLARRLEIANAPPIIPRLSWGADESIRRHAPVYATKLVVAFVHHTAGTNSYSPAESAAIVRGIEIYHVEGNGWWDIGYNFLVDKYGQVFEGRAGGIDQAVVGAHAQGYNAESTSVAQLGTFTAGGITAEAMTATAQLLGWKLSLHGVPVQGTVVLRSGGGSLNRFPAATPVTVNRICGHRDGDATSCPGDVLYAQLPELRTRATAFAGPVAAPQGQVTLAIQAAAVPYGSPAAFAGLVIRPGGGAAAGVPVALQKRGSTGAWVTVARATAAADGSWAVQVPWRRTGEVRARSGAASSVVANVAVVASVKLRLPRRRRVARGTLLRLSGRVLPADPVRVLVEFKGGDGQWRRVRVLSGRVRGTNFSAAIRMRRPGLYRLTARTAGPGAHVRDAPLLIRVVRGG